MKFYKNWCLFSEKAVSVILPSSGSTEKERVVSIQDKHLLTGIKALCRGSGALHRADQAALTAAMKSARLPPHVKTFSPGQGKI